MRTKFSGILTLLLAFVVQLTFAQEKTVSGTVTDNTGLPLPGVNIIVKNTSNGTQSDFDGNYTLQVNVGETLVFSYVGFKTVEQAVTAASNTYSVQMDEDAAVDSGGSVSGIAAPCRLAPTKYMATTNSRKSSRRSFDLESANVKI